MFNLPGNVDTEVCGPIQVDADDVNGADGVDFAFCLRFCAVDAGKTGILDRAFQVVDTIVP